MATRILSRLSCRTGIPVIPRRAYATTQRVVYELPRAPTAASVLRPPRRRPARDFAKEEAAENEVTVYRRRWLLGGFFLGISALIYLLANEDPFQAETSLPSPIPADAPVVLQEHRSGGVDLVPSGTSSVPPFPKAIRVHGEDYTLVGLGIRTVSFISIQVYVVGMYIHVDDVAALQRALVRQVDGTASSVTQAEREGLRKRLMDPVLGEELWEDVLSGGAEFRSVFRIVPTRNTDFQHLRDGWVRSIQARSTKSDAYDDAAFVDAMTQFKALFGGAFKKSVPKQKTLLLVRDKAGMFSAFYDPTGRNDGGFGGEGEKAEQKLGEITDSRISKAVWLCYLAGAKVASGPARESIVDGVLDLTSRPTGTLVA